MPSPIFARPSCSSRIHHSTMPTQSLASSITTKERSAPWERQFCCRYIHRRAWVVVACWERSDRRDIGIAGKLDGHIGIFQTELSQ